jgi:hypothetical protein
LVIAGVVLLVIIGGVLWNTSDSDGEGGRVRAIGSSQEGERESRNPFQPVASPSNCAGIAAARPQTNIDLGGDLRKGKGELRLSNGTPYDAVAIVMDAKTRHPGRAIYIRHGETAKMIGIPVGIYRLQFQLGAQWTGDRRFCEVVSTSEFDKPIAFNEHRSSDGLEYDVWSVTLNGVIGGAEKTHAISADAFVMP